MFGAIGRGGLIYYTLTEVSQVLYIIDKQQYLNSPPPGSYPLYTSIFFKK